MKKLFFFSLLIIAVTFAKAQQAKIAKAPAIKIPEFTKAELLEFTKATDLLTAIDKKNHSNDMIRNYSLTTKQGASKLSEAGPGGAWGEKQKAMIEKYAKKGTVFTLENIQLFTPAEKGPLKVDQPNVSFTVKE